MNYLPTNVLASKTKILIRLELGFGWERDNSGARDWWETRVLKHGLGQ